MAPGQKFKKRRVEVTLSQPTQPARSEQPQLTRSVPSEPTQSEPPLKLASPPTLGSSVGSFLSSAPKRVRGPTKGKATEKLVRQMGHAIPIQIPSSSGAPKGEHATSFVNEIGKEIRLSAPVRNCSWDKLDSGIREAIIMKVRQRFDIGDYENDIVIQESVRNKCLKLYRSWKHELHAHYLALLKKGVPDPKNHPHPRVNPNDWVLMVDVWVTEAWKEKSSKAKDSRSKLPYNHTSGSRSFAAAMSILEKLVSKSVEQSQPEVNSPMTDLEISVDVIGRRPGYLKGYGIRYKGSSSTRTYTESAERDAEVVALKEKVAAQAEQMVAQDEQMAAQAEQMAAQARKQADLEALVKQLLGRGLPPGSGGGDFSS